MGGLCATGKAPPDIGGRRTGRARNQRRGPEFVPPQPKDRPTGSRDVRPICSGALLDARCQLLDASYQMLDA